ncbi:protein PSK SIMULATOR 1 isoform X1 [Arachis hypogaea]|uniref:DUF668 domain-containing protein n=2 Tax=Arachis TaxID=3817 RepID=A0A444YP00_ARAHY|nr:uncharacterized protein LOC112754365 isoform X1 [Arachis hypogaea]RYR03696.1 hypothetical protein Ahy_B06g082899 [Arachis hypogaea]
MLLQICADQAVISMGRETVNGSWLSAFWPASRKSASEDKAVVGILGSEVAGLMLKVVNLWQSLSDGEVMRIREGIMNSVGVKMLVSDDNDFLMELLLNEVLDNFRSLSRSVARLGKRCVDPVYHRFEHFVSNPAQNYIHWSGWEYKWKKMERKVKKMEKFIAAMMLYSQELEVQAELEQTFRRMQANPELHRAKLLEFQKKVVLQRQEVRNLKDMSPWNRSYDYVVRLLARSLFTILERIILIFGKHQLPTIPQQNDSPNGNTNNFLRSHSFSALMHTSVHPSENDLYGLNSEAIVRRPASNSGFIADKNRRKKKQHQTLNPPALCGKDLHPESKQLVHIGAISGCMSVANNSLVIQSCLVKNGGSMRLTGFHMKSIDKMKSVEKSPLSNRIRIYSKILVNNRLKPAPFMLGDAALALHYANLIVLIERATSSLHPIDHETRDDLYSMLPTTIRTLLRAKLKRDAKNRPFSFYDANLAAEWSVVLAQILEWLAPLAHNMIRWHSERNFEKEDTTLNANVFLVQTLHFANQAKTEAAITDLLVALNYVCRVDKKADNRDTMEFAGTRSLNGVCLRQNRMYNVPL